MYAFCDSKHNTYYKLKYYDGNLCGLSLENWIVIGYISTPLSTFINFKFKKRIRNHGEKESKAYQAYMGWLLEKIDSLKEIVFLGAQKKLCETIMCKKRKYYMKLKKQVFL